MSTRPEDGDEQQEQREESPKAVWREAADQRTAVVVAELLHHTEDDRQDLVPLLEAVEASGKPLDSVHGCTSSPVPARFMPAPGWSR